jgi:WD40 repeat protein
MDDEDANIHYASNGPARTHTGVAAINSQYAAWLEGGIYNIQKLASQDEPKQRLPIYAQDLHSRPLLALSSVRPSELAVAAGARIQVWDLNIQACKYSLPGIGRTVTALKWSPLDSNVLATGSVDGSICIWDLRASDRPIRRVRASRAPCTGIIFSAADRYSVACIQERQVSIWDLTQHSLYPVRSIRTRGSKFYSAAWDPETPGRLVVATDECQLKLYDVSTPNKHYDAESSSSSNEEESQSIKSMQADISLIWVAKIESAVQHVDFLNSQTICALAWHGYKVSLYEIVDKGNHVSGIYSHHFDRKVDAVYVKVQSGTGIISWVGEHSSQTVDLPVTVLEQLGSLFRNFVTSSFKSSDENGAVIPSEGLMNGNALSSTIPTMKPISIFSYHRVSSGLSRTSNQLQLKQRPRHGKSLSRDSHCQKGTSKGSAEPSTPPIDQSMKSSLELPKSNELDSTPSMPFLSPSIPSRHSPNDLPSLEDSTLSLPPLAAPIFDSASASKPNFSLESRDSDDSDDETFIEGIEGSTTFMPGGINVPLPKACGALFAPNGQLLTFFPPKLRPNSAQGRTILAEHEPNGRRRKAHRVSRVFPSFGNFGAGASSRETGDESSSSELYGSSVQSDEQWPQITLPQASFQSQQSWRTKASTPKVGYGVQTEQANIIINVYEINDVSTLCTSQRVLAKQYRILPNASESRADMCDYNSAAAQAAGLQDTAYIWDLIAMLLSDKVPLQLLSDESSGRDVLVVARNAKTLTRSDSGVNLRNNADGMHSFGQLRWAGSPFGASWLVRSALEWAEQRSDIQLLACICAILTDAQRTAMQSRSATGSRRLDASTSLNGYMTGITPQRQRSSNRADPPIPVLRTNSFANSSSVYESPVKAHRSSNTSSRNVSQPTTPYLESNSSTPPFSLSLSRQGTHLSTSGSASPELHRSSFSAAAKYYAQSITDKFASYGTSPPTKRTGTSPGTSNELSVSVPSGSWSKSVSFAMSSTTTDTTRESFLSRSYDDPSHDHMYGNDIMVEDDSLAYQPRDPAGVIQVAMTNTEMFSDEVSGAARSSLIPEDMAAKTAAWCQYYAEQLRSWGLHLQAAELEKIMDIKNTCLLPSGVQVVDAESQMRGSSSRDHGVERTCAICFTVIWLMELLCPLCHHVTHLNCLEEYINTDETSFECPTSCGCECSDVVFAVQNIQNTSPQTRPHNKKRMLSYTDPRSWRARIEGDNNW